MNQRTWMAALAAASMSSIWPLAPAVAGPAFLNGGIGQDEVARMHVAAKDYPLRIEFSEKRDKEFLADAHVKVVDAQGHTVFRSAEAGPILLLKLDPGTYRVTARVDGRSETQTATLRPHKTETLYFHWQGA
jgi:hypothetical protein